MQTDVGSFVPCSIPAALSSACNTCHVTLILRPRPGQHAGRGLGGKLIIHVYQVLSLCVVSAADTTPCPVGQGGEQLCTLSCRFEQ